MNECQRFTATHIAKSLKKPTTRPKLVKECVCPNARGTAKLIANRLIMNKGQLVTSCIVHLANSANFEGVTPNKLCIGLTGLCFESPNDTIHVTVRPRNNLQIVNKNPTYQQVYFADI